MKYAIVYLISLLMISSCQKDNPGNKTEFKQKMRDFVIGISQYAKNTNPDFYIIPQNGIELVTTNGEDSGRPDTSYLNAIDANGQEDLFYGYNADDQATSSTDNTYLKRFLNISKDSGKTILVIDYCSTHTKMTNSYAENTNAGYISFAANQRELNNIPDFPAIINHENNSVITHISTIKNFLYLINPTNYKTKISFINAVTSTNYDLLIMDLFFNDGSAFTASEIAQLKNKANGGKRLVISYMSIGEAENYRYYWKSAWNANKPVWLDAENPNWAGNFKVKYWNTEWQNIIYGNDNSYLKKILDADFDGAYLDLIDAFEYYEN
ncbi:MAG: endo alpha-1,4 polygalactosaminidase [Saprospiraceae bacterium]|uniref:Endo alpha-1,4 polygalactosaminidase n=1 Tax=Candidatus Opimibacter skivensis TaxID=2982028 RepID=A0A9D7SX26_9BACT|nr:endo alpha-1,4 polygalactosaminidase [Candidatus Opimibacter skivensis]